MTAPTLEGRALMDLGAQVRAERARVERLTDALEAALRVLREVEWAGPMPMEDYCPSCGEHVDAGHAVDCGLDAALAMGGDA